jgi:hypothetical protein
MAITPLPPVPLRSDTPANFVAKADAFLAALNTFATEVDAVGVALTLGATNANSTTSMAIGTGSKSLTVQTGKSYVGGITVKISSDTDSTAWMLGDVTSYNTTTGALVVNVTLSNGAGTFASWTTSQSSPGGVTPGAVQSQLYTAFTTTGTAAAFALAPSPPISTLVAGQRFRVKFSLTGTATSTLAVNSTAATAIKQYNNLGVKSAPVIVAGQITDVEYDGLDWVILDPLPTLAVPPGTIILLAGNTIPAGYLNCPAAAANISRTTYADLFTAIGTLWGAGDGSTTFGIPYFPADYAPVQGGTVGSTTLGVMPAHTHTKDSYGPQYAGAASGVVGVTANTAGTVTGSTGTGTANLAAGMRVNYIVKY